MCNLLSAEFVRLFKSLTFKLSMLFSAGLGAFLVLNRWRDMKMHPEVYAEYGLEYSNADGFIFVGGIYLIIVMAVFIGIFVGTEYANGTIRNKLTAGHTRSSVYLSKFIVCAVADSMMHIIYILVVMILGNLLIGGTTMMATKILSLGLVGTIAVIALTALLVFISLSIQSMAVGAIGCLMVIFILICSAVTIESRLEEPEYYETVCSYNEKGEKTVEAIEKNYHYLTGTKRKVYEFLNHFLPSSQLYHIAVNIPDNLSLSLLYDGIFIFVTTGAGTVIFWKKNLK